MHSSEFDDTIDDAWHAYQIDLADRLHTITTPCSFSITTDPRLTTSRARIEVTRTHDRTIALTVHPMTLYLDSGRFPRQLDAMNALGWHHSADGDFVAERECIRVDELATLAVTTLREVCDLLHPTLLAELPDTDLTHGGIELCGSGHVGSAIIARWNQPNSDVGERTKCPAHLRALVIAAMEAITGRVVDFDGARTMALPTEPLPTFLTVDDEAPRVELWAPLAEAILDPAVAARIVAYSTLRNPFVGLVIRDEIVGARIVLEATVFHRDNLESALGNWNRFLHEEASPLMADLAEAALRRAG